MVIRRAVIGNAPGHLDGVVVRHWWVETAYVSS
jgi:hypothetical protein